MKIGKHLLGRGLVTRSALARGLVASRIFGWPVGSALLELGLIDEDGLASVLGELHGVGWATSLRLRRHLPTYVRDLLSPRLAERYRAVPLERRGRELVVAVADPANLRNLDDLSFATGLVVVPRVAPQREILHALERHYRIPCPRRSVPLSPPPHPVPAPALFDFAPFRPPK